MDNISTAWWKILGYLCWMLSIWLAFHPSVASAQTNETTGTFGGVFIGQDVEMVVFDQHSFSNGSGTLSAGIIATERTAPWGMLSFASGSSTVNASNAGFVDGYVRKYGAGSFVFPVGYNGQYRPAQISGMPTSTGYFTMAYFGVSPASGIVSKPIDETNRVNYGTPLPAGAPYSLSNKAGSVQTISSVEYWDIEGNGTTSISLSYTSNSNIGSLTNNDLNLLRIVGWNTSTNQWEIIPSSVQSTSFLGGTSTLTQGSIVSIGGVDPTLYAVITLGSSVPLIVDNDGDGENSSTDPNDSNGCVWSSNHTPTTANTSGSWKALDCDSDGLSNGQELTIATNPLVADSDGDGASDSTETAAGSSPTNGCVWPASHTPTTANTSAAWKALDCDSDGLSNGSEVANGMNPRSTDTDGDGVLDGADGCPTVVGPSSNNGCPIILVDNDGDGENSSTDPNDSNGCVWSSTHTPTTANTSASWKALDCDNDGLPNGQELTVGTNPLAADSDGDGASDSAEIAAGTSPTNGCVWPASHTPTTANTIASWKALDCDNDGLPNGQELTAGTNPLAADSDGDGASDSVEIAAGTSPTNGCVWPASHTPTNANTSAAWKALDCDNDGLPNGTEVTNGSNPLTSDTDGDGLLDGADGCPTVAGPSSNNGCPVQGVRVSPKVYLQGALYGVTGSNALMRDDLRAKGLLPSTQPYAALGLTSLSPVANVPAGVFGTTGQDAIVDWVYLELRSSANSTQVVDSKAALLQRDGDVVDVDGFSPVLFTQASAGSYFVSIRHRNHLGVMTASPMALSTSTTTVDFRQNIGVAYRRTTSSVDVAQVVVNQGFALWAGNALLDNRVVYQGTNNDLETIYQSVINAPGNSAFRIQTFKLRGYLNTDINMDGETIFAGSGNDIEFIYLNSISNHPGNTLRSPIFSVNEQLP